MFWREWQTKSLGKLLGDHIREWWSSLDAANPWPDDLDAAVRAHDAIPVCHRCSTPCELPIWFCTCCGTSVGPYNNILPFILIFSIGEVLRSGVQPTARFTMLTVPGYIIVAMHSGLILAPIYYIRLIANHIKIKRQKEPDKALDPTSDNARAATPDAGQD